VYTYSQSSSDVGNCCSHDLESAVSTLHVSALTAKLAASKLFCAYRVACNCSTSARCWSTPRRSGQHCRTCSMRGAKEKTSLLLLLSRIPLSPSLGRSERSTSCAQTLISKCSQLRAPATRLHGAIRNVFGLLSCDHQAVSPMNVRHTFDSCSTTVLPTRHSVSSAPALDRQLGNPQR
jgi:hypothetical protein